MNKAEFIQYLSDKETQKEKQRGFSSFYWKRMYSNSDTYWMFHNPIVSMLEDMIDLTNDNIVKLIFNRCLYGNEDEKSMELTYAEFIKKYNY